MGSGIWAETRKLCRYFQQLKAWNVFDTEGAGCANPQGREMQALLGPASVMGVRDESAAGSICTVRVCSLSPVRFSATPWTVPHQTPLPMRFFQARILERVAISYSRTWAQGLNLGLLALPALAGVFFTTAPLGKSSIGILLNTLHALSSLIIRTILWKRC